MADVRLAAVMAVVASTRKTGPRWPTLVDASRALVRPHRRCRRSPRSTWAHLRAGCISGSGAPVAPGVVAHDNFLTRNEAAGNAPPRDATRSRHDARAAAWRVPRAAVSADPTRWGHGEAYGEDRVWGSPDLARPGCH